MNHKTWGVFKLTGGDRPRLLTGFHSPIAGLAEINVTVDPSASSSLVIENDYTVYLATHSGAKTLLVILYSFVSHGTHHAYLRQNFKTVSYP